MFWKKKEKKESIKDPAVEYGKMINGRKTDKSGKSGDDKWFISSSGNDYDSGFVYYDE